MLSIPSYIEALGVRGGKIDFAASSTDIDRLFDAEVPTVERATYRATEHAKFAFSAATAEWIAWRLDGVSDVSSLLQFTEAMWVANVDYRYAREFADKQPTSKDPGKRVAFEAGQVLNAQFRLCPRVDGKPAYCAQLTLLARHVLPKAKQAALQRWLKFVVDERLTKYWRLESQSADPTIRQGPSLPREAFDPAIKFEPAKATEYIRAFLASVEHGANPYLRAPAELKKLGVTKPYTV